MRYRIGGEREKERKRERERTREREREREREERTGEKKPEIEKRVREIEGPRGLGANQWCCRVRPHAQQEV